MTLQQKADYVVLRVAGRVENTDVGVPSLCLPAITLTDGPNGVASAQTGVSQFPAEIGVAATFNPGLARDLGAAMAEEARAKGYDVLQGPNLNLTRVPVSGRVFETYGEDPTLSGAMGVAAIEGIQSQGVMADAKHFTGYTQEVARGRVNQRVSARALAELYDAPFALAVRVAHVASLMCAMGALNGVNTCSSPQVYATLRSWGFTGFVRSDFQAVSDVGAAVAAGMSLVKPATSAQVVNDVRRHHLSVAALNSATEAIVRAMFAYGFVTHPRAINLATSPATPAHAALATRAAEQGAVLLKDSGGVLPLAASTASIAVIGVDASTSAVTTGGGSSTVRAHSTVTPLTAMRSAFPHAAVTYSAGGPRSLELDQLQFSDLLSGKPLPKQIPIKVTGEPGKGDLAIERAHSVTAAVATASRVLGGDGWSRWHVTLRVHHSGTYEVALQEVGDTWLTLDGRPLISSAGIHGPTNWATTASLSAGRSYDLAARWFSVSHQTVPKLGISDVTGQIARAVAAAKRARVAVVFAGAFSTEGADQASLSLPGDANALISAVAAVNPRTVVVLNTSGAVYMPWLSKVAAVVENWYPGEADGTAIAAVLSGAVDPSGRLPVSFPSGPGAQPAATPEQYPGVKAQVSFTSGLDVGYRWYEDNHVTPLFAFGYGLSYTTFSLSQASVAPATGGAATVRVTVTNTGPRRGVDVVEAYVGYPPGSGEPPAQLRAFARVGLAPGQSSTVALALPASGFTTYSNGAFSTPHGVYRVMLGPDALDLPITMTLAR